jgi:hypothetical protein
MKPMFALVLFLFAAAPAKADGWSCQLVGEMSGVKLGFIFGGQVIRGDGEVRCTSSQGSESLGVSVPVRLSLVGGGIGFDFTIVRHVGVISAAIGEVLNPRDMLGQFSVATSAGVTLINQGHNVDSSFTVQHKARDVGFEVGLIGEDAVGLGARLHGLVFVIEPRR